MTTVNITDEIYFGYREEAVRRSMFYNDRKPNIPGLINKVLVEQLIVLQKEEMK